MKNTLAYLLYSEIVQRTPVDTGRARGNWNVAIGSADPSTSDRKTPQYQDESSMPKAKGDESVVISNNLEYINMLEYGGYPKPAKKGGKTKNGYSKQAPHGMVGVTLANAEQYTKLAIDKVVKK